MTREEKKQVISNLAEQLKTYPNFYVTDINALNAEQTADLRKICFNKEVKLVMVKNTLFIKALEQVEKADAELVGILKGSSSIMFSQTSKTPAVVIKEFRKTSDKPILKAAYVQECVYIGDQNLDMLLNIKSREELIGDIIGLLQSPMKSVISALQANGGQKIAGILKTLEERN